MQAKTWPKTIEGYEKLSLSEVPLFEYIGNREKRWGKAKDLIRKLLHQYKNPLIIDLAMGSAPDTVALLKEEYSVISNEIDLHGIEMAEKLAVKENVRLNLRRVDWTEIINSPAYKEAEFDVAFSLGNSFPNYLLLITYLRKKNERRHCVGFGKY